MSLIVLILKAAGLTTEADAFDTYVDFRQFVTKNDPATKAILQRKLKLAIETIAAHDDGALSTLLDDVRSECISSGFYKEET